MSSVGIGRWISVERRRGHPLPYATGAACVVLAVFALVAVVGPWIRPHDPNTVDLLRVFEGPSPDHWLGTDESGRDLASRLVVGTRPAVLGPLVVVTLASAVSIALALTAAWFGGLVDVVIARALDVLLAFPGLLIAIVAAATFGPSLLTAAITLSISYVPYIGRVIRAEAIRQRSRAYVEAAWVQGMSSARISLAQILPNLWPTLSAQMVMSFAYATIDLAAISYLGLGVQPPDADWGTMVALGQTGVLQGHPLQTLWASACLIALILSLGVVGDALGSESRKP